MSEYKLIALDMDGTFLNSEKEISKKNLEAVNRAFDAGKEVVLCTGRCIAELRECMQQIPDLRYIVATSGAMVYDRKKEQYIYSNGIESSDIYRIMQAVEPYEVMLHFMTEESIVERRCVERMDYYGMKAYTTLFQETTTQVENLPRFYQEHEMPIEKVNLHFHRTEDRDYVRNLFEKEQWVLSDAEQTSLEISAKGTTKGTGLMKLCEHLGIPMEQVIAVGDADNDLDVLKKAGLAVAMANANENVKRICDVEVSDCDHDGCAEAIEKFLI